MASSPWPFLQLYLTSCNLWLCHDELFQSFPNKGTISLSVFLLHLDNSDLNIHFRYHILWETLPNCPSLGWLPLLYVPRFFFLQLLSSHQMSLATSFTRLTALQWQGPAPIMFTLPALVPGQVHIVNIWNEWVDEWVDDLAMCFSLWPCLLSWPSLLLPAPEAVGHLDYRVSRELSPSFLLWL